MTRQAFVVDPFAIIQHVVKQEDMDYRGRNLAKIVDADPNVFRTAPVGEGIGWMYTELSHPALPEPYLAAPYKVDHFEVVSFSALTPRVPTGDVMYVDENGLLGNNPLAWIIVRGAWQPFAGKGLVLGTDRNGNSIAPKDTDADWLAKNVMVVFDRYIYIQNSKGKHATLLTVTDVPNLAAALPQLCDPSHSFWQFADRQ